MINNQPAMQEMQVQPLGWEKPLKEMATHSRILAWEIPLTGEPGGLQSMRSQRAGHNGLSVHGESGRVGWEGASGGWSFPKAAGQGRRPRSKRRGAGGAEGWGGTAGIRALEESCRQPGGCSGGLCETRGVYAS